MTLHFAIHYLFKMLRELCDIAIHICVTTALETLAHLSHPCVLFLFFLANVKSHLVQVSHAVDLNAKILIYSGLYKSASLIELIT